MFNKRPDGRLLRNIDPLQLITGFIMKKRYDAMNMYEDSFDCTMWDKYIKEKEAERIMKYVREDAYVIALAIEGNQLDSVELSEKIEKLGIQGKSHLQFIIGGSLGLHHIVLSRADYKLSFSKYRKCMKIGPKIPRKIKMLGNKPTSEN